MACEKLGSPIGAPLNYEELENLLLELERIYGKEDPHG